jgi:predicted amidohydrolase YtcJ
MTGFKLRLRESLRPTRRQFLAGTSILALPSWVSSCAPSAVADLVLLGGEIHTVDPVDRRVEAIAITGGKIMAAGSSKEIHSLIGANTRQVDLEGRTVLPGINDSHLHLMMWGLSQPPFAIDLTYPTVKSIADVVAAVGKVAATTPSGEWIIGRGWDQPYFSEGRAPTAADLDAVSQDNPVVLTEFSGHAVWVNNKAMQIAGIGPDTDPGPGGVIVRDESGQATGVLFEYSALRLLGIVPKPSDAQKQTAIIAAMQQMLSRGITSATDPRLDPAEIEIYDAIASQTSTPKMRMNGLLGAGTSTEMLRNALDQLAGLSLSNPQWMQVTGVKIMGDGIPTGNKTAWLNEPYEGGGNGSLLVDGDDHDERAAQLLAMIHMIHAEGLQVGTHATGDRTIDTAVAAYQSAQQAVPRPDPRHYLIHADMVSDATLAKMASLGVGANFNPEIKYLIADSQVQSIGAVRAAREWPYHSALQAGVQVASASDAPVTEGNWLQGLATCLERTGKQTGLVSGPEERIVLDQAIRSYTLTGAWQDHADSYKGSLQVGKVADLCVLDERLSSVPPASFAQAKVAMTLVNGEVVHEA